MNWTAYDMKEAAKAYLKHNPHIPVVELKGTTSNLDQGNWCPDRDSRQALPIT
jgi:hypothetical protein